MEKRICMLFIVLVSTIAMNSTAFHGFAKSKSTILSYDEWKNAPFKIEKLEIYGRKVDFNTTFALNEPENEWSRNLSFLLTNTSGKKITSILVKLLLTNPKDNQLKARIPFHFYFSNPGNPPFTRISGLQPGNQLLVKMSQEADYAAAIKKLCNRIGVDKIEDSPSVKLIIDDVTFEDGTLWRSGTDLQKQSADSHSWIPIQTQARNNTTTKYRLKPSSNAIAAHAFIPAARFSGNKTTFPAQNVCYGSWQTTELPCAGHCAGRMDELIGDVEEWGYTLYYAWEGCWTFESGWCDDDWISFATPCGPGAQLTEKSVTIVR